MSIIRVRTFYAFMSNSKYREYTQYTYKYSIQNIESRALIIVFSERKESLFRLYFLFFFLFLFLARLIKI